MPGLSPVYRCAGCGEPWDTPTDECLGCGRGSGSRIEWKSEYGRPAGGLY